MKRDLEHLELLKRVFEWEELTVSTLVPFLCAGYSLRVAMEPDPAREGNLPHYWETLEFPAIVGGKDHFWAFSFAKHLLEPKTKLIYPSAFCYASPWRLFANYEPFSSEIRLMPGVLYRSFRWGLKKKWRVVWDSSLHRADECDEIAKSIRSFCGMRIVIMFDEMIFCVPVDIPEYHPEDGTFSAKTSTIVFPEMFLSSSGFAEIYRKLSEIKILKRNFGSKFNCNRTSTFMVVSTGGDFLWKPDEGSRPYDRLLLLVESDFADTDGPYWPEACGGLEERVNHDV